MPESIAPPIKDKIKQLKQILKHELLLYITGQKWRQVARIPSIPQRILWVYDWNDGIGDSIIGLSQRFKFPSEITVDLCITKGPAELFQGDTIFRRIYQRIEECPPDYDFILLQRLGSASIRCKLRHYPRQPFAVMVNRPDGEPHDAFFDFVALRMAQLFGSPTQSPTPPRISPAVTAGIIPQAGRIAVVLGGWDGGARWKEGRRRWRDLPGLLATVVQNWPEELPGPHFALIGSGPSAQEDLASIPPDFVDRYCTIRLGLPNLAEAAREIQRSTLFLGADGGLMHIAAALGKPGVALFAEIRPEWFLLPNNPLTPLYTARIMADIPRKEIVDAILAAARQTVVAPSPHTS